MEEAQKFCKLIFNKFKESFKREEIKSCDYTFDALLGEGSFGKVYEIEGTNNVVKIIKKNEEVESEIAIHQYLSNESEYILPFLGMSECKNDILIKMPLGLSLQKLFKMKDYFNFSITNPYFETIKKLRFLWAEQIAIGLLNMHDSGVLHLDMKPDNIILIPDEDNILRATLSDFGLSQFVDGGDFGRTSGDEVVTIMFRDINISCGGNYKTTKTDVWSYGFILMELFFGITLFDIVVDENDFKIKLLNELKHENYTEKQSQLIFKYLKDSSWISERLFKKIKVPITFKDKMLKTKCKPIFSILNNEAKDVDYTNLLHPINVEFFKNRYYTEEEWKNIWDVIDVCLDLNVETRIEMSELIYGYKLFTVDYIETKMYAGLKELEDFDIDDLKDINSNVKNLAKIWLKEIRAANLYPTKTANKTIINLLIKKSADVLGYRIPSKYHENLTLEELGIDLNKLFPDGILKNCCNYDIF